MAASDQFARTPVPANRSCNIRESPRACFISQHSSTLCAETDEGVSIFDLMRPAWFDPNCLVTQRGKPAWPRALVIRRIPNSKQPPIDRLRQRVAIEHDVVRWHWRRFTPAWLQCGCNAYSDDESSTQAIEKVWKRRTLDSLRRAVVILVRIGTAALPAFKTRRRSPTHPPPLSPAVAHRPNHPPPALFPGGLGL
jgi:hypothetical protein